jgi:hypothetical protein
VSKEAWQLGSSDDVQLIDTAIDKLGDASVVESSKWERERGKETEREKRCSAEIVWTAVRTISESRRNTSKKKGNSFWIGIDRLMLPSTSRRTVLYT